MKHLIPVLALFQILIQFSGNHAVAQEAGAGAANYARHCIACHGTQADGAGPMQPVLLVPPADLTRLSADNGGIFPLLRVISRIDGRDPLVSHGSEMPVYGEFFANGPAAALATESGQPVLTTRPIADLVVFLKTLQVE